MSNGGVSNSPTGATGDKPTTAKIDSPIPKGPNAGPGGSYRPVTSEAPGGSYSSAASEAPGGKGGFPSAQSPYSQQPQVYMPPAQPTFYDQALNSPYSQSQFYRPQQQFYQPAPQYYQQQPQYYQPQYYQPQPQINSFGLGSLSGGMGNAYARRPQYSPPSPIEARPPRDEMRYVPGVLFDPPPRQLMSDSWGKRPVQPSEPVMAQQGANISNPNRDRAREINMRSYNNPSSITAEDMAFLKDYDAGRLY